MFVVPRRRLPLLAVLALTVALLASLWAGGPPATAQPAAPPSQRPAAPPTAPGIGAVPRVTVVVRSDGIEAPATVPTGLVAVTFENATRGPLFAIIIRPNPGATVEAVIAALEAEDEAESVAAFMRVATALGGPQGAPPGQSQEMVLDFAAGQHVMVSFGEETEMPLSATFRATPPPVATQPPPTVGEIEMGEFFFRIPAIPAGTATYRVVNVGQQLHHMIVGRLAPGVTLQQVFEAEEVGTDVLEAGLVELVPGLAELSPGQTAWPTLTFTPGNYAMVCFIPDPATGQEHVELGMVAEFTVR